MRKFTVGISSYPRWGHTRAESASSRLETLMYPKSFGAMVTPIGFGTIICRGNMQVGSLVKITESWAGVMGIITEKDWDWDNDPLWKVHLFDGNVIYVGTEYLEIVCE